MLMIGSVRAVPLSLFFCVHFGGFMLGHGFFLAAFFLGVEGGVATMAGLIGFELTILLASHLLSFLVHWVFGPERRASGQFDRMFALSRQMFAPYRRIVVMHITILLGAGLTMFLGSPRWVLYLFIALKLGADLSAHVAEHVRRSPAVGLPHTWVR